MSRYDNWETFIIAFNPDLLIKTFHVEQKKINCLWKLKAMFIIFLWTKHGAGKWVLEGLSHVPACWDLAYSICSVVLTRPPRGTPPGWSSHTHSPPPPPPRPRPPRPRCRPPSLQGRGSHQAGTSTGQQLRRLACVLLTWQRRGERVRGREDLALAASRGQLTYHNSRGQGEAARVLAALAGLLHDDGLLLGLGEDRAAGLLPGAGGCRGGGGGGVEVELHLAEVGDGGGVGGGVHHGHRVGGGDGGQQRGLVAPGRLVAGGGAGRLLRGGARAVPGAGDVTPPPGPAHPAPRTRHTPNTLPETRRPAQSRSGGGEAVEEVGEECLVSYSESSCVSMRETRAAVSILSSTRSS